MRHWLWLIVPQDGCGSVVTIHADTPNDKAMLYCGRQTSTCSPASPRMLLDILCSVKNHTSPMILLEKCYCVRRFLKMSYTQLGSVHALLLQHRGDQCAWWADLEGRITRAVVNYNYAALHKWTFGHLCGEARKVRVVCVFVFVCAPYVCMETASWYTHTHRKKEKAISIRMWDSACKRSQRADTERVANTEIKEHTN